jgi:hypothetical protein
MDPDLAVRSALCARLASSGACSDDRLLASPGALTAAARPGDVVSIDRAMYYRDWTLTEGRLQRVFESWLETSGVSSRVVDVEDGGRLRRNLTDRGGIVELARRTVPLVAGAYDLQEIAGDAAPGGALRHGLQHRAGAPPAVGDGS